MATSRYILTDADLLEAEHRARRFSAAYTGTSGTLAFWLMHAINTIREERRMKDPNHPGYQGRDELEDRRQDSRPAKGIAGERVEYQTGAVRSSDAEATRYDLISPVGLEAVARAAAEGAAKYSDYNWERGMPVSDLLNHALRHIYQYLSGDRSEDHLGHAAWNLVGAVHSDRLWPNLNGCLRGPGCRPPE